jgi:transcriptional regulator with XRE-family HTH domain
VNRALSTQTIRELTNPLRCWRVEHGLTLEEVADLVGLSVAMVSYAERGQRQLSPTAKVRVARRLGVRVRDLFAPEPITDEAATA